MTKEEEEGKQDGKKVKEEEERQDGEENKVK